MSRETDEDSVELRHPALRRIALQPERGKISTSELILDFITRLATKAVAPDPHPDLYAPQVYDPFSPGDLEPRQACSLSEEPATPTQKEQP